MCAHIYMNMYIDTQKHACIRAHTHTHTSFLFYSVCFLVITFHSKITNSFLKNIVEGKLAKNMDIYCCLTQRYVPDTG